MSGRQPNGRQRIYQGKDQRWHCYVTVGTKPDGSLNRKHLTGMTAGDVSEKLTALEQQRARGGSAAGPPDTVEAWLRHWLENVVRPRRAYKTHEAYRPIVELHVIPHIGQWRLDGLRRRLEPEHVEAMYAKLGKTLAPSYLLQVHRVLRKALKDATRRGRAGRNVCDLIDPPTSRRTKVRAHTLVEAQAIIRAVADDDMAARWLLGILLGLRQGEVLGLRWHHLKLEADPATLSAEQQLQRRAWRHGCEDPAACARSRCRARPCPPRYRHGCEDAAGCRKLAHFCPARLVAPGCSTHRSKRGCPPPCRPGCTGHARGCPARRDGGLVEVDLKSEKSVRELVLPPVIVDYLVSWRERQQRERAQVGKPWDPQGLVFTTAAATPIDPRRDHAAWERLLVRAGVADGPLHGARHDAGTLMIATGTDISVVQEVLGHTDIRTTRGYVDIANDLKQQAVNRVAAALFDGALAGLLQPSTATTRPQT
jgi:integrase